MDQWDTHKTMLFFFFFFWKLTQHLSYVIFAELIVLDISNFEKLQIQTPIGDLLSDPSYIWT